MEEADAHIAGTEHLVVLILGTCACAIGKEILPTLELDAYTAILVDVILRAYQIAKTITIVH